MTDDGMVVVADRRRSKRATAVLVGGAAVSLVVLAPTLADVYSNLGVALRMDPRWLAVVLACELASFGFSWDLQRVLLRTDRKADVAAAQLAGNAISQLVPAGGPAGSALQLRMLTRAGLPTRTVLGALAASGVIGNAALLTLPLLALPAIATGDKIDSRLEAGVWAAACLLVILAGVVVFATRQRILTGAAGAAQWSLNVVMRGRGPRNLGARAMRERDDLAQALRQRWARVTVDAIGRTLGDFLALYLSLVAAGAHPTTVAALAAYAAANVAGMVPITPGGLGYVEAGLVGVLSIARVARRPALIATAAYRLISSGIPIIAGLAALAWSRHRTPTNPDRTPPDLLHRRVDADGL
jgi:uncharacterized protein (TIRG00374 family)